jgi:dTMP kinase
LAPAEPAASSPRGRLITFEGGEGAGKSTQIDRLATRLRACGIEVVATREPGGTPGAEAIRSLLVGGAVDRWTPLGETFLHIAARIDHVARVIRPALARSAWVLADRFLDSTRVYQGVAGKVGLDTVDRLHEVALGSLRPDLTLLLDLPVAVGLNRRRGVATDDRYERMGTRFHDQVRKGFLELAAAEPARFRVIDAGRGVAEVEASIRAVVAERFELS